MEPQVRRVVTQVGTYDYVGEGDPNGQQAAPIGATFRRKDGGAGTSFYVKEADDGGDTGWVGK